jgi:mono/diheme cytochrome c family protein
MRSFIFGVVATLAVLILGGLGFALLGFFPTNANTSPPRFESHLAMSAVDASADRRAAHVNSPVLPTDQNLIDGMKVYTMNCAGCHGALDRKPAAFGSSFYPPAPQLILHPPDDPDWHTHYVVQNGIRYTGMPAWDKTLSEDDIWKVTIFLSHIEKLPAAAQDYWKTAFGVSAPTGGGGEHEEHDHDNH